MDHMKHGQEKLIKTQKIPFNQSISFHFANVLNENSRTMMNNNSNNDNDNSNNAFHEDTNCHEVQDTLEQKPKSIKMALEQGLAFLFSEDNNKDGVCHLEEMTPGKNTSPESSPTLQKRFKKVKEHESERFSG